MWELASKAGLKVQVIHVPATFPAEDVGPGHMLSGLGVPDMRGRVGTPTYYTSDPTFQPGRRDERVQPRARAARRSPRHDRDARHRPVQQAVLRLRRRPRDGGDHRPARAGRREAPRAAGARRRRGSEAHRSSAQARRHRRYAARSRCPDRRRRSRSARGAIGSRSTFPVNWVVDRAAPLTGHRAIQAAAPVARSSSCTCRRSISIRTATRSRSPGRPTTRRRSTSDSACTRRSAGPRTPGRSLGRRGRGPVPRGHEVHAGQGRGDPRPGSWAIAATISTSRSSTSPTASDTCSGGSSIRAIRPTMPRSPRSYAPEVLKAYQAMDALVGKARALAGPDALFLVCSDHGFSSFRRGVSHQHLARPQRVHDAEGPDQRPRHAREAVRHARSLPERRLVAHQGVRARIRRHLRQPRGPRERRHP